MNKKVFLIVALIITISSCFNRAAVVRAETYQFTSVVTSPAVLTEDNIKWAEITMTIANDTFNDPLNPADINLNNDPAGVTVESVTRVNATTVLMKLEYNFDDFDADDVDTHVDTAAGATVGGATFGNWYLPITAVVELANSLKALIGTSLSESNLNGATIELVMASNDFNGTLLPSQFVLNNAPAGLNITSVIRGSQNKHATMTLAFNGIDFDSDIPNFSITALDAAHNGSYNTTSNTLSITAVVEPAASMTATTIPNELFENTLAGSQVNLALGSDGLKTSLGTGDIQLNNVPTGLTVSGVVRKSSTEAQVTLAFDGTDFDTDYASFTVGVLSSGLLTAPSATSNTMTIYCLQEVSGLSNYIATGEAYPTEIIMAGYDARSMKLYINTSLHTVLNVTGKTATFEYFITVFDGNSAEIGNDGDISSPRSIVAAAGASDVDVTNRTVTLTQAFPAAYRIVVTVKSVTLN